MHCNALQCIAMHCNSNALQSFCARLAKTPALAWQPGKSPWKPLWPGLNPRKTTGTYNSQREWQRARLTSN
eukprot:9538536-Lingulodinium_polyedra.AAC.1